MPTVIDLQAIGDAPGTVEAVVQTLLEGGVAGLPFECAYGRAIFPWGPHGKRRSSDRSPHLFAEPNLHGVLAFRNLAGIEDAFGIVTGGGRRLIRRCWPGAAIIEFATGRTPKPLAGLPDPLLRGINGEGGVRTTVPSHRFVQAVLNRLPGPLLVALPSRGSGACPTATELADQFNDEIEILVDDGPVRYDQAPTRVVVESRRWRIVEEGVLSAMVVQRMASEVVLFVCTGNTCRSPMAEALCRRRLSDRLQCAEDDLLDHGFAVLSAGLSALAGAPANPEAIALLERYGMGLHEHESRPLTRELLSHADRIVAMTRSHRDSILAEAPEASGKVRLLSPEGVDLCDPIGGGPHEYQECFDRIASDLDGLIEELLNGEGKEN